MRILTLDKIHTLLHKDERIIDIAFALSRKDVAVVLAGGKENKENHGQRRAQSRKCPSQRSLKAGTGSHIIYVFQEGRFSETVRIEPISFINPHDIALKIARFAARNSSVKTQREIGKPPNQKSRSQEQKRESAQTRP